MRKIQLIAHIIRHNSFLTLKWIARVNLKLKLRAKEGERSTSEEVSGRYPRKDGMRKSTQKEANGGGQKENGCVDAAGIAFRA